MYFILHASVAHNDPVVQTMEKFSGYPTIEEPPVANSEPQQNQVYLLLLVRDYIL